MKKTDKKIDNAVRAALNKVCQIAQEKHDGFKWLTHFASYDYFPGSLVVVCVYDSNDNLAKSDKQSLSSLIKEKLESAGIVIKDIRRHVSFDTEENCTNENNGKWHERFH